MTDIVIAETFDYPELVEFFISNGLEFSAVEEVPTDIIKCWKAAGAEDGKLLGGCVLAKREGRFICDGIATDEEIRGLGIGKKLLSVMFDEARGRGADVLYLLARAPEFYKKNGFISIPREEAPQFFECFTCHQYGVSCHPEVMRFDL